MDGNNHDISRLSQEVRTRKENIVKEREQLNNEFWILRSKVLDFYRKQMPRIYVKFDNEESWDHMNRIITGERRNFKLNDLFMGKEGFKYKNEEKLEIHSTKNSMPKSEREQVELRKDWVLKLYGSNKAATKKEGNEETILKDMITYNLQIKEEQTKSPAITHEKKENSINEEVEKTLQNFKGIQRIVEQTDGVPVKQKEQEKVQIPIPPCTLR